MRSRPHRTPPASELIRTSVVATELVACAPVSIRSAWATQDLLDGRAQLVRGEGLQENGVERVLRGLLHDLGRAVPRDQDRRDVGIQLARALEDLEPGEPRHLVVDDEEVERLSAQVLERDLAVVGAL